MDTAGGAADVQGLAGVLLQMHPLDARPYDLPVDLDVEPTVHTQRFVVLADLVVLWHVRIEVVLPREPGPGGDPAVEGEPDPDGRLDRRPVGHRQAAG
jgi:hypothetical protein